MAEVLRGIDTAARGDCRRCGVPGGSVGAREIDISPLNNNGWHPEWLVGIDEKLCQVEAVVDSQGKQVADSEGRPEARTPNPRVELPYTYLIALYVMHCPSLMTAVSPSEGFVPFVQRLESLIWS